MPTSELNNVQPIVEAVVRLRPKKVLDLGAGFGKYGVLLREYLDIAQQRIKPEDWQVNILGVDAFEGYVTPIHEYAYSTFLVDDFTKTFENYKGWDVVLLIDSLEHVDRALGEQILATLIANNKAVIVSCPDCTNTTYPQGAVNGNEFETHRANWKRADFELLGGRIIHSGVCVVAKCKGLYTGE